MRVLYLTQYFAPEVGATQARAYDTARALVQAGHRVTLICEFPNHPGGRIPQAYRGRWIEHDEVDGIEVIRVWVKAAPVKTFGSRLAFYLSYMVMAVVAGAFRLRGKVDVVYATSPPLFVGVAGVCLSLLKRAPLVFEVRDLWPEAAQRLGELRNRFALGGARWLESLCYGRSRRIVTVTRTMARRLRERGIDEARLEVIENGANTALVRRDEERGAALRQALGLEEAFVALYVGLHGLAHDLDAVLEAARLLPATSPTVILLVGEGPTKAGLRHRARALALDNVRFHPEVPREDISTWFSMADVSVVPLREAILFQDPLPLKMLESWACACPVLLSARGAPCSLITDAAAGVCVPPQDPKALAEALTGFAAKPGALRAMGLAGQRLIHEHGLTRAQQTARVERLLLDVVGQS